MAGFPRFSDQGITHYECGCGFRGSIAPGVRACPVCGQRLKGSSGSDGWVVLLLVLSLVAYTALQRLLSN